MSQPGYPNQTSLTAPPSAAEREQVVQALCAHFAADHMDMASLEARLAMAYEAPTRHQLAQVEADLPSLDKERREAGAVAMVAPYQVVEDTGTVFAMLGGVSRRGSWIVPRHLRVVALLGGAEIDLREAKFAPGVTEIDVAAVMGGVEITVPRGVRVETSGFAFMGGFDASAGDVAELDPHAPVLRVSGFAVMGGCEVKVKRPSRKALARFQAALYAAGLQSNLDPEQDD